MNSIDEIKKTLNQPILYLFLLDNNFPNISNMFHKKESW